MQLNDAILEATGGPTVNEGLSSHFSRTASETLGDAEQRWLKEQVGVTSESIGDCWYEFTTGLGYSGSLNDRQFAYWTGLIADLGGFSSGFDAGFD